MDDIGNDHRTSDEPGSSSLADAGGSEEHPLALAGRTLTIWRVSSWVAVVVLTGIAAVIGAVVEGEGIGPFIPALVLGLTGGVLATTVPTAMFRRWRYWVTGDRIEIRHGLATRVESSIPHFRIQHIDVHQRPLQRAFGVVELRISTASVTSDAKLPGVSPDQAAFVRHLVLLRAQDDDAV